MTLIGRLFVRGATAAGAIGAAAMLALAPQPGVATTLSFDDQSGTTTTTTSSVRDSEPAPSAACLAARNAFVAALKADVAEDTSERNLVKSGADTNDPSEDQAESANFKSLRSAMVAACEAQEPSEQKPAPPAPSAACTAAKTALQDYLTQLRATEKAEWTNGTEGTAADLTSDQAAFAQLKTLFKATATACGFPTFGTDGR